MDKTFFLAFGCTLLLGCNNDENSTYSNTIKASITVGDIPKVLIIDHTETPIYPFEIAHVEYSWSVTFDINDDGIVGLGDLVFSISESKKAGEIERGINFSDLEANLLQYGGPLILNKYAASPKGIINFEVNGNTLTFIVDRDLHEDLKRISNKTQINAIVYRNNQNGWSADYLPEFDVYTQVQDPSSIDDELLDYYGNDSAVDISNFSLEIYE